MNALLIVNPVAGATEARREHLRTIVGYLTEQGWMVRWHETAPNRSATALAQQAVDEGCDVVVVAGGDGTINEAIQALVGTSVRLGVLPVGTANLWSMECGIATGPILLPQNLQRAAEVLVAGETIAIDVGLVDTRYFLLVAGIGFDAWVTRHVDLPTKRRLGGFAYLWKALTALPGLRGTAVEVTIDGATYSQRALLVTVSNTRLYAGLPLAPTASFVDGMLDVTIFCGRGWPALLKSAISGLLGFRFKTPEIIRSRGRVIEINAATPLPVQVDGEPTDCQTPLRISVISGKLQAIVTTATAKEIRQKQLR